MQVLEPANIPLPASPAPKNAASNKNEEPTLDYFSAPAPEFVEAAALEERTAIAASIPLPSSPTEVIDVQAEILSRETFAQPAKQPEASNNQGNAHALESATSFEPAKHVVPESPKAHVETGASHGPTVENRGVSQGDVPQVTGLPQKTDDQPLSQASSTATSRDSANEQNIPPAVLEVNLIDLDGPESNFAEHVNVQSPAKRTPLGVASPNRLSFGKVATPKKTSPKVRQLQDFFEKKAFSPSPSPEVPTRVVPGVQRTSTTPASTPSRPKVLG